MQFWFKNSYLKDQFLQKHIVKSKTSEKAESLLRRIEEENIEKEKMGFPPINFSDLQGPFSIYEEAEAA